LALGFLVGRFIKGPSRSGQRSQQSQYYGQGYQGQGYQGQGYQGSSYQSGGYASDAYQTGGYQSSGWQSGIQGGSQGSYRGSDNPAEGVLGSGENEDNRNPAYQGRYESSGIQGNAFQQGGYESSGYQAEGAVSDYEGGQNAYETGPDITEGSDTDYPRYDPSYAGSGSIPEANTESTDESTSESSSYTPTSRR
jgi:hypothetical protein